MDDVARVEVHIDHFRPKSCIRAWPPPQSEGSLNLEYDFHTGSESPNLGYYLVAYHPFNFVATCATCNCSLKSDYFPVSTDSRQLDGEDPAQMMAEQPLLLYPIGDLDEDPETFISFIGYIPIPAAHGGVVGRRARVTIDFFRLGPDQGREDLIAARAVLIRSLFDLHQARMNPATDAHRISELNLDIERFLSPRWPHTNCARSYMRLCEFNEAMAEEVYQSCRAYLESHGY